ncbi:hypothetical protein GCM10010495_78880 [Kitasatospora herbaricolor]|nr:hypothetical protein GCM10010495_78880 [Kitasatospora herbaricolor]
MLGTANHWLLDGVAGSVLLAAGCLVQYVLTGRRLVDPVPARPAPLGVAAPVGLPTDHGRGRRFTARRAVQGTAPPAPTGRTRRSGLQPTLIPITQVSSSVSALL